MWLAEHPVLRLGVDPNFPPWESIDEAGRYSGIMPDYMNLVSERLGIQWEKVVEPSFEKLTEQARNKTVDVLPGVEATPERSEFLELTQPYLKNLRAIVTQREYPLVNGVVDLADTKVALVRGHASSELVTRFQPDLVPVYVESTKEALEAVAVGKAEAAIGDLTIFAYLIREYKITNLKLSALTETGFQGLGYRMGVRSDWPVLHSILDKALASITREEHQEISERWSSPEAQTLAALALKPPVYQTTSSRVLVILGGLVALGVIFGAARYVRGNYFVETNLQREIEVEERKTAEDALTRMTGQLIRSQEEERRRIARELHDDLNQRMAMLAVELGMLAKDAPREVQEELSRVKNEAVEVSEDLRRASHRIHPATLEHLGLVKALKRHCDELSKHESLRVDFLDKDTPESLPPEKATCLYRIAQESLRNVVKHAKATRVTVTLELSDDVLSLRVQDDGVGFDSRSLERRGLGLVGMEERLRLLNGRFSIQSTPGRGTCLEAALTCRND